jgi:hypothetical protein
MGSLVLPYPPPPPCKQLCTRSCSNKHSHTLPAAFSGPMARPPPLPPASSSLTHARRMDCFCNHIADQLGSLARLSLLSLLTVYVGVVERAPASRYTYSSSTHRFPDERTPIVFTPLSATLVHTGDVGVRCVRSRISTSPGRGGVQGKHRYILSGRGGERENLSGGQHEPSRGFFYVRGYLYL